MLYRYALHLAKGGERPAAFRPRPWGDRRRPIDPLLAQLLDLRHFCLCCELPADRFAGIWHDKDRVQLLCLDAAPELRERLNRYDSAVLMSATLTPFSFFRRQFGLEGEEVLTLDLPSPFPRENRRLLVCDQIDTTYDKRSDEAPAIADIIARSMAVKRGNYLAFFSSFAFRDEVTSKLPPAAATVIRQTPGMDIRPLLLALSRNRQTTILVAAVMGGVMAEGVDFAEDLAIGAFVVGPGLPPLEPGRELIRNYFDAHHLDGFEQAYICPGLNKVVQAGGRIIRTETDRGFVMLIGRRFVDPRYHDRLPEWWRAELQTCTDPAAVLSDFWADV
jgi:DNA excision repair protein ERCC-2